MVITPHALIGLLGARAVAANPAAAVVVGATSHFLADRIPHTDYAPFSGYGRALLVADVLTATVLVRRLARDRTETVGAISGAGVDGWVTVERIAGHRVLDRLHAWNHTRHDLSPFPAVVGQLLVGGGALALLRASGRSSRRG